MKRRLHDFFRLVRFFFLGKNLPPSGWFWHVHHAEYVCEYSDDIRRRVRYIKTMKPLGEVRERLRLLQPVRALSAYALLDRVRRVSVDAEHFAAIRGQHPVVAAAHRLECPGCVWDPRDLAGRSIFGRGADIAA